MKVQTPQCVVCGVKSFVEVQEDDYRRWQGGVLAQRAFPEMHHRDREMLITGTHPKCWDEMYPPEEN